MRLFILSSVFMILTLLFSVMPMSVALAQGPAVEVCAANGPALEAIPYLKNMVRATQKGWNGDLNYLTGTWATDLNTAVVDFQVGDKRIDTKVSALGRVEEAKGVRLCYMKSGEEGPNPEKVAERSAFIRGSDGVVLAFISVKNTYQIVPKGKQGERIVQISQAKPKAGAKGTTTYVSDGWHVIKRQGDLAVGTFSKDPLPPISNLDQPLSIDRKPAAADVTQTEPDLKAAN